jgi:hypothetical protein
MSRRFRRDCFLTLCLSLASIATVWADSEVAVEQAPTAPAFATDLPVAPPLSSQDVAREVLRLQEEMGGSIVTDWNTAPTQVDPTQRAIYQPQVDLPNMPAIRILRESARQLEQSAHQLESLDLYSQADALREMAQKLRLDARKLRAETQGIPAVDGPVKRS